MTTNYPNPVDGDVQALIDICKSRIFQIKKEGDEGLFKHKLQEMLIYSHALASLTTPPAQLLRPVELPEPYDDGHGNLWLPQDAVISAVKNAGAEVKS